MLKVKRVYEARQDDDGTRILVDRLWPRGLSSARADIDQWLKEVAPNDGLRRWFAHQPEKWPDFRQKYLDELTLQPEAPLRRIAEMAASGNVTLVYATRDSEHNNAIVLKEFIGRLVKNSAQV